MSEWRPIESAPKDGTIILLYSPETDGMQLDHYGAGQFEGCDPGRCCPGFWLHFLEGAPTHWMPLPDPPK